MNKIVALFVTGRLHFRRLWWLFAPIRATGRVPPRHAAGAAGREGIRGGRDPGGRRRGGAGSPRNLISSRISINPTARRS